MKNILYAKPLREEIKKELIALISTMSLQSIPTLAIIQVGNNPSSTIYIKAKIKFGEEIGIPVAHHHFGEEVLESEIISLINELNKDEKVGGIIIQLPLPPHIKKDIVIESIAPEKDVDGLHSVNLKKLLNNDTSGIMPATTRGIMSLFNHYNISLEGKSVLIIGRSSLVGKPTALACLNADATVTIAHRHTLHLPELCKNADVIISAIGVPHFITPEYVREGHIIIDVGITRHEDRVVGDVDFEKVLPLVEGISPVPGGVGVLTVASLFQNIMKKYTR